MIFYCSNRSQLGVDTAESLALSETEPKLLESSEMAISKEEEQDEKDKTTSTLISFSKNSEVKNLTTLFQKKFQD